MGAPSFPSLTDNRHTKGDLKSLRVKHDQILQLFTIGVEQTAIAEQLEVSYHVVKNTVSSTLGQARIKELRELAEIDTADIAVQIHLGAARAIRFLNDVISAKGEGEGSSKGLRYKAAVEMLKMDGYTPITRSISLQARGVLGEGGMKALLEKGRAVNGMVSKEVVEVIEADFTELVEEET